MSDIKINVDLNSSNAQRGLTQLKSAIGGVGGAANSVTGSFLKLAAAAGGIAGVVSGLRGIAQTGGQFEQLTNSLNIVFGSVEAGSAALEKATTIANNTGMSIESLSRAMIQLKGAGVDPTVEQLTAFADAAAVSTDAAGAFEAAVSLVSRTTAGGLGLEELERLGDRGIPVYDILNEKIGLTRLEISKVGQTAEGAARIINALTEGMAERFGGAALKNATTFAGVMNQMRNQIKLLQTSLFQAGFGDAFKEAAIFVKIVADEIKNLVTGNEEGVAQFLQNTRNTILNVVQSFAIGAAALYDTFAPALEGIFNFLRTAVNNLVSFANTLPAEFRALGLVGFLMLGAKGKGLVLLIAGMFDSIINIMSGALTTLTPVMNFFIDLTNKAIEVINDAAGISNRFLGTNFEPIELIAPIDENAFTPENLKAGLADLASTVTNLFGEIADIPLIGENAEVTMEQRVTDVFANLQQRFREEMHKFRNVAETEGGGAGGGEGPATGFLSGFKTAFDEFKLQVEDTAKYGSEIFGKMTDGFSNAILSFVETGKLSFKDLFKSLMSEIIKMQANRIFLALFGGGGGLFAGLFADGGYIPAGQFGIVGERGPEIVNGPARVTGTDETARMFSGKSAPTINYYISAVDTMSFKQALARDADFIYNLTRIGARRVPG